MRFNNSFLSLVLMFSTLIMSSQTQIGQDIDGEQTTDESGRSLSFNADGMRVAIGSIRNEGGTGHVRVYEYNSNNSTWQQLGQDIDGEALEDRSGSSVSLSADGLIVAIGAPSNMGAGSPFTRAGHVRVYRYVIGSNTWIQLGQDIDGETEYDSSGSSVSLSADGLRVAIGAPSNQGGNFAGGHVRVYDYNSSSNIWQQKGQDIDGEVENERSGIAVSISRDGERLAVGASGNNDGAAGSGQVKIYYYNDTSSTWQQLGQEIDGEAEGDISGQSVSLSAEGTILAIGAPLNDGGGADSGHVRIYEYDVGNGTWQRLGQDIDGEAAEDGSGTSVSLSADGLKVAIGAVANNGAGIDAGHTRVYAYNSSSLAWEQLGEDFDGEAAYDASGISVGLSADGQKVAIGAYLNAGSTFAMGHVRVYQNAPLRVGDNVTPISTIVIHPNPVRTKVTISNPQNISIENVRIFDIMGRLLQKHNLQEMGTEKVLDISTLSPGTYMVFISSEEGQIIKQLLKD